MINPVLLPDDYESRQLAAVRLLIEARIAKHRLDNDTDKPELRTARLRGRIAEAQEILALVSPPAPKRDPAGTPPESSGSNADY